MVEDAMRVWRERTKREAFTLVELLVAISIIAILIGLLTTGLSASRQKAWQAACLSNCRQCISAWHTYTSEYGHFPHADLPVNPNPMLTNEGAQTTSWAGVDWYTDEIRVAGNGHPAKERPLNEYLGMNAHQTSGGDVTRCPGDTIIYKSEFSGNVNQVPNVQPLDVLSARYSESRSPDGASTFHGAAGTSYYANDWVWVSPSAPWGMQITNAEHRRRWLSYTNKPENIESPSRFMMFGESGIMDVLYAGSYNPNSGFISIPFVPHNFRHGGYTTSMAFLDGSVRAIEMEVGYQVGITGDAYSFIPQPRRVESLLRAYPDFHFNGRGFAGSPPPSVAAQYGLN